MDIRKLWLTLVERAAPQRRYDNERIRVIRTVLNHLRGRETSLLDRRNAVNDEEQRTDLANKLSVLRAQRAKGLRVLRELRADRRAFTRGRASGAEGAEPPPGIPARVDVTRLASGLQSLWSLRNRVW